MNCTPPPSRPFYRVAVPRGPMERAYDELQLTRDRCTLLLRVLAFVGGGYVVQAAACLWALSVTDWHPAWLASSVGAAMAAVLCVAFLDWRRLR